MHKIIIIEYLLPPIGVQAMAPPLAINKEQILDTFYGIWSTMVSSFSTATAYYLSTTLNGSLSHKRSSPIMTAGDVPTVVGSGRP